MTLKRRLMVLIATLVLVLSGCLATQKSVTKTDTAAPSDSPVDTGAAADTATAQPHQKDTTVSTAQTSEDTGLSPASQMMIKSCDNYISVNPESPKIAEVLTIKASVYYNNEQYAASRDVYTQIVEKHTNTQHYSDAVRMIAQSYYQEKNFEESQKWFRKMADVVGDVDKGEALSRIAESIFKMAEMYESQERFGEAAAQYERIALEFPDVKIADVALFNAGLSYEKQTEWSRSILVYQRLGKRYEESELRPKALFRTAKCYEKLMQWENAAQTFLNLVKRFPGSEFTATALYNAGFCFENAKKLVEAAATFEKLALSFPNSEDAADVLFRAGELYGKLKDWPSVTRVNQEFYRRYGNDVDRVVQAQCMVGVALYMQSKVGEAIEQLDAAVSTFKKLKKPSDVNRFYAAKAQYTIGEIRHEIHNRIKLSLPRNAYKRQLKQKSDILDEVVDAYSSVIQYQISEWTTRAIYQLGQAYEDFAAGVFNQERPANMSLEDRLALELGIAKAVEEYFIARALKYHEQNVKLGIKENLEDKHVLNSRRKLTYLPYVAGDNYLALVEIAKGVSTKENLGGFALIAQELEMLQKIAPFQERAIELFLTCLELGTKYEEKNTFYAKASGLITKTSCTVGETYANVATIAREAPIPGGFDAYEAFVYKTKLLKQIEAYENNALTNFLKTVKIAEAYEIEDEFVSRTKELIPQVLFTRGRCYDLLCIASFRNPPFPSDINDDEKEEYQARFEEIGLRLQEQAFEIYRAVLTYADSKYAQGEYVYHAYVRMYQNYPEEFGSKKEKLEDKSLSSGPKWKCSERPENGWNDLGFDDSSWKKVHKGKPPDSIEVAGFPVKVPVPMWLGQGRPMDTAHYQPSDTVYFRRSFYITQTPHKATLNLASSGRATAFLNGKTIEWKVDSLTQVVWHEARKWDLTGQLRQGKNVLAIKGKKGASQFGYGVYPFLELTLTSHEYLPLFPGTEEPLDKNVVAEGMWVFPTIKNFSPDTTNASNRQGN